MASVVRNSYKAPPPEIFVCPLGPGGITHIDFSQNRVCCRKGCFHAKKANFSTPRVLPGIYISKKEQRKKIQTAEPILEGILGNPVQLYRGFVGALYSRYVLDEQDVALFDLALEMEERVMRLEILLKKNDKEHVFSLHLEVAAFIARASNLNKRIEENAQLQEFAWRVGLIKSSKKTTEVLPMISGFGEMKAIKGK